MNSDIAFDLRDTEQPLKPGVSVVVPVFNSKESLSDLSHEVSSVLSHYCEKFEILLVNDGSEDRSWSEIMRLANQNPRVKGYQPESKLRSTQRYALWSPSCSL